MPSHRAVARSPRGAAASDLCSQPPCLLRLPEARATQRSSGRSDPKAPAVQGHRTGLRLGLHTP
eukprot:2114852-Alexandrium_andersonii.AAC.1